MQAHSPRVLLAGLSNWDMLDDALRQLEQADVVCVMEKLGDSFLPEKEMSFSRFPDLPSERGDFHEDTDPRVALLKKMLPKIQARERLRFLIMCPWSSSDAVVDEAAVSLLVLLNGVLSTY